MFETPAHRATGWRHPARSKSGLWRELLITEHAADPDGPADGRSLSIKSYSGIGGILMVGIFPRPPTMVGIWGF